MSLGTAVRTIWASDGPRFDPYFRKVSEGEAVVHAAARKLVTPRGRLSWAPHLGFDVNELLNEGLTEARAGAIAAYVRTEVLSDERVAAADVTFTLDESTNRVRLRVVITTSTNETFALVLSVSKLTNEILAIERLAA